jgi:hypothetical protein
MTASFKLTLDTTAPTVLGWLLDGGGPVTSLAELTLSAELEDPDTTGYQMKVWGDVDPTVDPNIQLTEEESEWFTYEPNLDVTASEGDGAKTIEGRVRDDVWNETTIQSSSIEVNTELATITITAGPSPSKISKVAGKDLSVFTFKASDDLMAWQVKVVSEEGDGVEAGLGFVEETAGSENLVGGELEGGKNQTVKLSGDDLQTRVGSDAEYIIKVFGQGLNGLWSA